LGCFVLSFAAPQLVAFGPDASITAVHVAKTAPHFDDADTRAVSAAVIPASFHEQQAPRIKKRPTVNEAAAKQHTPSVPVAQSVVNRRVPRVVMAKAYEAAAGKKAVPVMQVVFAIETTAVRYNDGDSQMSATDWNAQVWQIVLIAPPEVEVAQNLI
jgi:hypothetical protein